MDETVYDAAWRAYKAAPRAVANGLSRSAVRAAVDAALAICQPVGLVVPYERALDLINGAYNAGQRRNGYNQQAMDLHDAIVRPTPAQGWVVADGQGARWRRWGDFGPEWTSDRHAALHFARRTDAEAFAKEDEDAWLIQPIVMPTKALERHHCVPPMWLSEQIGDPIDDLTPGQAWRDGFNECRTRTLSLIQQELTETGSEEGPLMRRDPLTKKAQVADVLKAGGRIVPGARPGLLQLLDHAGQDVPAWQTALRAAQTARSKA